MMDDVQIERKGEQSFCFFLLLSKIYCLLELSRLLATAKDEDRKEMIRRAMHALDDHEEGFGGSEKFSPHTVSPNVHASVYNNNNHVHKISPNRAHIQTTYLLF